MNRFIVSVLHADTDFFVDDRSFAFKVWAINFARHTSSIEGVLHVRVFDSLRLKFVFSTVDCDTGDSS